MTAAALVDRARNAFGAHLTPDCRHRLLRVLSVQTQETWDDAASIIVSERRMLTLWQAWIAVDPDAVRSKPCDAPWPRIPDQLTLYRALRHVTSEVPS